ncbi:MAG: glycosyltransferase family 2 protein [Verrucomicrobiales bacterium]|nr:glycosyltransferase family 2 protein [Verrucomicrobiales bacterium]
MLISVITVTLNPGDLLKATVDSVVSQSSNELEMVIQDGGSTDGSLEFIGDHAAIKFLQEPDEGIYDAMNRAIARSTGDYLLFLNAGDCLASESVIADIAKLAESGGNPDLIFCDYRNVANGREIQLPDRLDSISLFRARYCHQAVFFSRELFDRLGGYDISYLIRADLEFLYRCFVRKPLIKVLRNPHRGVLYEGAGYSARQDMQSLKAEELKRIRRKYLPAWKLLLFSLMHEMTFVRLRIWLSRRAASLK